MTESNDTANDTAPATDAGTTKPAGEGVSDEQMSETVAEETSPDLDAEDVFERESGGTDTDKPASEIGADDVA